MAASAMYEDLGIAACREKSSLVDLAALSVKSSLQGMPPDAPPLSSRRRPRPPTLVHGAAAPCDLPMMPRPPLAPMPTTGASPRPSSVPRLGSNGTRASAASGAAPVSKTAAAEAAADAEILRMRFSMGELQAKCDRQAKEIADLRQQQAVRGHPVGAQAAKVVTPPPSRGQAQASREDRESLDQGYSSVLTPSAIADIRPVKTQCDQACQTEERLFIEQLDLTHREAAQKGKELRKVQETVRLLRMELQQEKVMSDQYRGQVDGLEKQLQDAMSKQHRAEGERTLVEWRLRNAEGTGRLSRSCTPQPSSSRGLMKAWGEPGRMASEDEELVPSRELPEDLDDQCRGKPPSDEATLVVQGNRGAASHPRRGPIEDESGSEDIESDEEQSVALSDGSDDITVFHPPPSRGGICR